VNSSTLLPQEQGMENLFKFFEFFAMLKDNPVALVTLIALCALGVTAYSIRAIIVTLEKRGGVQ
jgi:hypothetical protein